MGWESSYLFSRNEKLKLIRRFETFYQSISLMSLLINNILLWKCSVSVISFLLWGRFWFFKVFISSGFRISWFITFYKFFYFFISLLLHFFFSFNLNTLTFLTPILLLSLPCDIFLLCFWISFLVLNKSVSLKSE